MKALISTLALLLAASPAIAQYRFDAWTTETGLPQNSVTSLIQSRDGYLWLGTSGGLVRFDGVKFTVLDSEPTSGLRSVRIHALAEDPSGALWIATEHGGLTRYVNGTFTTFQSRDGLPTNNLQTVFADSRGTVWVGTRRGLVRFKDGQFTTFTTADGLPGDFIIAIAEHDQGLWLGTDRGLVRMTDGGFRTLTVRDGLPSNVVWAIEPARDGSLWVGTEGGLACLRSGRVAVYTTAHGLPSDDARRLLEDRSGHIWVGTEGGVARLFPATADDGNGAPGRAAVVSFATDSGLSDTTIRSLLEDFEGNIWIGTNTGGLNRLKPRQVSAIGREEGLPGDGVVPITEGADGSLWIGMTCGGLVRYQDGLVTTYGIKDGLPNDCVWSLQPTRDGGLWIGTWGGGLTRRDKDGRFTTYQESNSQLASNEVLALYEARDGALWVGTTAGLHVVRDGSFTTYRRQNGLVHDDVRFITEDREGAVWVGTPAGASRFKDGAFTNVTIANGLSSDFVRAIHQSEDGTLWFGTYGGGLNRLKDGRFTHYTIRQGMFENIVSRILEDDDGYFWMTGNKGIARVRRAELDDLAEGRTSSITSVAFGVGDGMKSSECNGGGQPAGWRSRDGRLWLPTARGVVSLDPRRIQRSEVLPPVVIERVLVDRSDRDLRAAIAVRPGQGDVEIHYTGLSFTAPEYVRFRYKLDDLDRDWTDAGTRRAAYYSHLPAGRYTFRVMAANRDGVWNTAGVATLGFQVLPPFYETWWFTTLAVAVVGGLLFVAHDRRVRRLKRARAQQEAFSQRLIESQEGERKRIAAELHDSLSQTLVVIKNRALLSLKAPDDREKTLEQIDEIAEAATHAIDEIKEISYNLRPYHLDRLGLTNAIEAMVDKVSGANGLRFTTHLDSLDGVFAKSSEINVYRIVQEGVTNIVKHAGASEAAVTITKAQHAVVITLRDNGCGFVPNGSHPSGFGLIGIAERARLLGGEPLIESAPGMGTTITITLATGGEHGQ
jgi:ligand-binding sensor domain-containing protein/signal transduction histidine kinase